MLTAYGRHEPTVAGRSYAAPILNVKRRSNLRLHGMVTKSYGAVPDNDLTF
jgi:hypothetical protein